MSGCDNPDFLPTLKLLEFASFPSDEPENDCAARRRELKDPVSHNKRVESRV